jgi:hypothetical protein
MKLPYDTLDQDTLDELSALFTLLLMTEEAGALQDEYKAHLTEVRDEINTQIVENMNIPNNVDTDTE